MSANSEIITIDVIINTFMNNPDFYDKSDPQYVNTSGKNSKLQHIVTYLKELVIDMTVPEIIKKWKFLVAQFKKCLSEEKNCTTGSSATENNFAYFEDMMFLKPTLQHMKVLSSMSSDKLNNNIGTKRTFHAMSDASVKVPELDMFAKKTLKKMQQQDNDVANVTHEMLNTLKAVQSKYNLCQPETSSGSINYTNIIAQAMSKVPTGHEDDCLMHVLNDLEQLDKMHPASNDN